MVYINSRYLLPINPHDDIPHYHRKCVNDEILYLRSHRKQITASIDNDYVIFSNHRTLRIQDVIFAVTAKELYILNTYIQSGDDYTVFVFGNDVFWVLTENLNKFLNRNNTCQLHKNITMCYLKQWQCRP